MQNDKQSTMIEDEEEALKRMIADCEREVQELKLDRADMLNHLKMSDKIKKSKNQAEIAQGQTLIFETNNSGRKGGRKK